MTAREYFILNRHFHKIFWLQLSSSNHVRHHGIHYYYTIRIWQEKISHDKQRNVGRRGWPDFAQKPIDKRKSENVGWFVIIQAQDKSLIYNRSKFIYFNVASIDSTRFNPRVPTHYTLPRIYVVALLRILGFLFTIIEVYYRSAYVSISLDWIC